MSLVAYGSSDESEEETPLPNKTSDRDSLSSIALPKKPKETVKITIPSLSEFKDEDPDSLPSKKLKLSTGSGLFSILPPPKYASENKAGFTPYVLTKKKESVPKTVKTLKSTNATSRVNPNPSVIPKLPMVTETIVQPLSSTDESNDKETASDFFSLETVETKTPIPYSTLDTGITSSNFIVEHDDVQPTSSSCNLGDQSSTFHNRVNDDELYTIEQNIPVYETGESSDAQSHVQEEKEQAMLANEGFRKLQGKRKEFENINFIDIKADDQLIDRKEWLMKSLTEENTHRPSRRRHDMPTQQQKRKHQITYLAFQAKERELDLKNQWAMNSRTKRETQAKYGF